MYESDGATVVPSWYGATDAKGAIFESVFHDIRPSDRAPRVLPNEYVDRYLTPVVTLRDLTLVDLTTAGLHAIGLTRASLIESRSARYPWTNGVAERLRTGAPHADGFIWVSRAFDTVLSVVLYGDKGRAPMLGKHPTEAAQPLGIGPGLLTLREHAVEARITLVVP
jgi:hypothetical protein